MTVLDQVTQMLARLPGYGPRSARRAALFLIKRKDQVLLPLAESLLAAAEAVRTCSQCGNLDTHDPCGFCTDPDRDDALICVVEDVADLWALDRGGSFRGRYHVLGGTLSALDGVGPEDLKIDDLVQRCRGSVVREVIIATNPTVDGQTTAHYVADRLAGTGVQISGLALGVPVGGELDYLDDGTLSAALRARRPLT